MEDEKEILMVVKINMPDGTFRYQARVDGNLQDILSSTILSMELLMENCQEIGRWPDIRNELAANLFSDFEHFNDKARDSLFKKLIRENFGKKED